MRRFWVGSCVLFVFVSMFFLMGSLVGCQKPANPNMPRMFQSQDFDPSIPHAYRIHPVSKYATYETELKKHCGRLPRMDHKDYALLAANRAMIEYALGNTSLAAQTAMDSQAVMTGEVRGEQGKAVAAALANEEFKVFKGECYEIAMLNAFVGLCQLHLGDQETAAVGFRRALEADKMSKEGMRDDFRLAYWGLGMSMIDEDMNAASQAFEKCQYKSAEQVAQENLVFLISLGRGPWKLLTGLYGTLDQIEKSPYAPCSAEVFIDGESVGKSVKLLSLHEQSKGVPRSGKDAGQVAKAIGKYSLSLTVGVFLGRGGADLIEKLWQIKADSRTCYMLPDEIHVASTRVTPGQHTVRVKFFDSAGNELKRYEQVWHYIQAPTEGRRFVSIRSEFDRCNIQGPVAFTRINNVSTDKVKLPPKAEAKKEKPKYKEVMTVRFRAANIKGLKVGDTVKLCHFYRRTEYRMDSEYHWRYEPMLYDHNGHPMGYPNNRFRMQDYDIGLIGLAKVTKIKKDTGYAEVMSLTTDYKPRVDDMITATRKVGHTWE